MTCSIYLYAFAGNRNDEFVEEFKAKSDAALDGLGDDLTLEECLLYAGHVGISFSIDGPIFGFKPRCEASQLAESMDSLKRGDAWPGIVSDDSSVFEKAKRTSLDVYRVEYVYSDADYENIYKSFEEEVKKSDFDYCFPGGKGDCNCATWPGTIGIDIPEPTGSMRLYMKEVCKIATVI